MKLDIEPYREDDSDTDSTEQKKEEADEPKQVNGNSDSRQSNERGPVRLCEIREYEARYNLKGERELKPVKENKEKEDADNEDDALKYCMRSEKWYERDGGLETTTLDIYSPLIQQALREVIKEYPGVNLRADPIILSDKLKCVFHYRKELEKHRDEHTNSVARMHINLLLKYMARELHRELISYKANVESCPEHATTEFDSIWTVFKPGELVVSGRDEKLQVLQLKRTWFQCWGERKWWVIANVLTHDGESYGYVEKSHAIGVYFGTRSITKLPIFPLKYHKDATKIRSELIARGKKYCTLVGRHYRSYNGIAIALGNQRKQGSYGQMDEFPEETTMINGRIMIDCKMFAVFKAPNRIVLDDYKTVDLDLNDPSEGFSDEDFLICTSRARGFSLTAKKWCAFYVDLVQPVEFNTTAFDHLLIPDDQKRLVHALVRTHSEESGGFDDMIKGKGKGLIFVLHGVPGVGKTFTAESVADHLKRPLYILHSGELGITPESVETNLTNALMLATTWKAVLLIDEADVFLEQRTVQDLTRNCLVSQFLRILEYYEGLMMLTTNRIVTFDLAFKSRIHLALKYNPLDATQRRELWRTFISRTPTGAGKAWPSEDLDYLAAVELNGRQIKNAVRTANALATAEGKDLDQQCLRIVLDTLKTFEDDLNEDTQETMCASPKSLRRQSTMMSRLSMLDGPLTEEPNGVKNHTS